MITVTHAKGSDLCTACGNDVAVACIDLSDGVVIGSRFNLCEDCASTLLENLQRKEDARNAY